MLAKNYENFETFAEMFFLQKSKIIVAISRGNKKTEQFFYFDLKKITPGVFSQHF
jgi:hypothetical protein